MKTPWIFFETNVTGTLNLLELCRQCSIQKFIQASTSTVYGMEAPTPTLETACTDNLPQTYAASNKAAEVLYYRYHSLFGLAVNVVRNSTVYDSAGRPDISMFRFAKWMTEDEPIQLLGDGEQSRDFPYLDDIACGTIAALKSLGFEILNLGGHEFISMNTLITMLEEPTCNNANLEHLPPNPGKLLTSQVDVTEARQVLGWEPWIGLLEGVKQLVDLYNTERTWAQEVSTR